MHATRVPVVSAHDLRKSYGSRAVLDGVSITIGRGEIVGVVGDNGTGKSTLGRILADLEVADSGTVTRRRGATFEYLSQAPNLGEDGTVGHYVEGGLAAWREAAVAYERASEKLAGAEKGADHESLLADQAEAAARVERAGGWDRSHEVERVLRHVGMDDPGRTLTGLSGGEQRRVALARLLVARPDLAVLDEPSNHLDIDTLTWLEGFLASEYEGAVLLITHDRYLLDATADRTIELSDGQLYAYDGGYADYLEGKAERLSHAERVERNRQNMLRRELAWLARQPKARTTKQKARIGRAEALVAAGSAAKQERSLSLAAQTVRGGETVLTLEKVSVAPADDTPVLLSDVDLIVEAGDRLGIVGRNGVGKTSLLRVMLGELAPVAGSVRQGSRFRVAYFDQHKSSLKLDESVFDNVAEGRSHIEFAGTSVDCRSYLDRFLFPSHRQATKVGALSGGERARVALAQLLAMPANIIVLDEPTNDLDVSTLGALEELLVEYLGTVLLVTHDRYFLNRVATGILALEHGTLTRYPGGYDDYLLQRPSKREAQAEPTASSPAPTPPAPGEQEEELRPLTYKERNELDGMLERIDEAEGLVATLEAELSDPETYRVRADEVAAISSRLEEAKTAVTTLMTRWEELEARKDIKAGKGRR